MNSVVVVGAGLAGLTCARRLHEGGMAVTVIEAGDAVGGRVRTDVVDGFKLDRGFQVLLTAYPEVQRWLDLKQLDLQEFWPGARVWTGQKWDTVADPRRRWTDLFRGLTADIGSTSDKLKVVQWAVEARDGLADSHWDRPETTALAYLQARGFSAQMIERFWRPWLSGIFLERELETSSRMLEFVFGMFARGGTAVPREGMQAIPAQLATGLPWDSIILNERVSAVESGRVWSQSGREWRASQIVIAVEGGGAARFGLPGLDQPVEWRGARCLYFAVPGREKRDPLLMLNGAADGVINHAAWMEAVAPSYAPEGQSLLMVGLKPDLADPADVIESRARRELDAWFGAEAVSSWRMLKHSWIPQSLPRRSPLVRPAPVPVVPDVWRCGDVCSTASIQGAMESGRMVAEALLNWR